MPVFQFREDIQMSGTKYSSLPDIVGVKFSGPLFRELKCC
jgi:hypothetical protein